MHDNRTDSGKPAAAAPCPTGPRGVQRANGRTAHGSVEGLEALELLLRLVAFGLLVPAALGGGPRRLEAVVLAAPAEHLGAGHHRRLPVEDDRVVLGADGHAVARAGTGLHQLLLDAEAAEAVGEVAHGLVVVEVGLPHPALGLLAAHPEQPVLLAGHGEAGVVDGLGPDHDPGGLLLRLGGTGPRHQLGERGRQLAQPEVRHGGDLEDAVAARLQVGPDHLGQLLAVRDVDLVQHDQARPVSRARRTAAAPPRLRSGGRRRGRGSDSRVAVSSTCTSTLHRSTCRRNSRPRPRPWLAPGIEAGHVGDGVDGGPGGDDAQVGHQRGGRVVGDLRLGREESTEMSEDLPALG
ncbi:hypothetical protein SFUMM280S_02841 [Streptomyces fumanus]